MVFLFESDNNSYTCLVSFLKIINISFIYREQILFNNTYNIINNYWEWEKNASK